MSSSTPHAPISTTNDASASACKTILATSIARPLLAEVRDGLSKLQQTNGNKPHLTGILANDDPSGKQYAEWTGKTCEENSIKYTLLTLPSSAVEETILTLNADPTVHGIIVYYPIHGNAQDTYLANLVSVNKDVEGLSHTHLANMYGNVRFLDAPTNRRKSILPCTPLALIKTLEYLHVYNPILPHGNRLFGHTVAVINRSEVVGRPLAALLANDGATVYSVDVAGVQQFTRGAGIRRQRHEVRDMPGAELEDLLPKCDVVITGVPVEGYKFPCGLLKEGAVCVNFSTEKNFGLEVKDRASIYVPAVGKVTITILLRNLLRLVQNNLNDETS